MKIPFVSLLVGLSAVHGFNLYFPRRLEKTTWRLSVATKGDVDTVSLLLVSFYLVAGYNEPNQWCLINCFRLKHIL